jgi:hypothetical protein
LNKNKTRCCDFLSTSSFLEKGESKNFWTLSITWILELFQDRTGLFFTEFNPLRCMIIGKANAYIYIFSSSNLILKKIAIWQFQSYQKILSKMDK